MNNELETKKYFRALEQIKLSDSSRERMKGDLLAYSRFHAAPEDVVASVPTLLRNPFLGWLTKPAPVALAVLLLVGTTTSLLAKEAAPGDFLYALKTNVNENLRSVFTLGTSDAVESPTEVPIEQLAQATTTQADETTTSITLAHNDTPKRSTKTEGTFTLNARTKVLLETAVDDEASVDLATMLAQGTISVGAYTSDLNRRDKTLRELVKKHDAQFESNLKKDFKTKLDSATSLTEQAQGKSEADARVNLDKAAVLVGEVEATLSTLGHVTVEDGVIVDIDFDSDPLQEQ